MTENLMEPQLAVTPIHFTRYDTVFTPQCRLFNPTPSRFYFVVFYHALLCQRLIRNEHQQQHRSFCQLTSVGLLSEGSTRATSQVTNSGFSFFIHIPSNFLYKHRYCHIIFVQILAHSGEKIILLNFSLILLLLKKVGKAGLGEGD